MALKIAGLGCAVPPHSISQRDAAELSRAFCLESEAQALRDAGLGKGSNYKNTLVVADDGLPIENELRFPDEYVRHKVLDLVLNFIREFKAVARKDLDAVVL